MQVLRFQLNEAELTEVKRSVKGSLDLYTRHIRMVKQSNPAFKPRRHAAMRKRLATLKCAYQQLTEAAL